MDKNLSMSHEGKVESWGPISHCCDPSVIDYIHPSPLEQGRAQGLTLNACDV